MGSVSTGGFMGKMIGTDVTDLALENHRPNWVPVMEQPLHTPRRLRVVCIGAGYAGLMLAYKWKHQPGMSDIVDLAIYEKNPDVGGTWFENRYPGVACDVRGRLRRRVE